MLDFEMNLNENISSNFTFLTQKPAVNMDGAARSRVMASAPARTPVSPPSRATSVSSVFSDSPVVVYKQESMSHFQRVKCHHWQMIKGITVCVMPQFQLEGTLSTTIKEIKKRQPKLFTKESTNCVIYKEMRSSTKIENEAAYQHFLMETPKHLYFRVIESKADEPCCKCTIL